jgi:hypothetical protein
MKWLQQISPNLLFIGLIVLFSTSLWSLAFWKKEVKTYRNTVSVVGVATQDVVSDKAVWQISLTKRSLDRAKNLKEVGVDEKTIHQFITSLGFNQGDISDSEISVSTIYKPKDNGYGETTEIIAYETKSTFFVTTKDVHQVSASVNKLRVFAEEHNIDLVGNEAQYTYSAFESQKVPLLKKAIEDAQSRANALVNATNGVSKTSIGKVLSAQQGVFQINAKNDSSVSDYGNFDLSSVEKTIRATVRVDFSAE